MSAGGATQGAAGTLDLGSGNTFPVADATEDDFFDSQAWWAFTIAAPSVVTLTSTPGSNFALFQSGEFVTATEADGSEEDGVTATYLLVAGDFELIVGIFNDATPVTYQITYARKAAAVSPWNSDLADRDEENVVTIVDGDSEWRADVIRPGSRRIGDYTIQETLGGPWGTAARDCAIDHALWGDQNSVYPWDDSCPLFVDGPADLEIIGGSSVAFHYSDHTGSPFLADSAHMVVSTVAYGIWLKPVEENLPATGVLSPPDPVAYGYPANSRVEYETDRVELRGVEIAERVGTLGDDPDARYAVNYKPQPSFVAGEWGAWQKGGLPGAPVDPAPAWVDGPEDYSLTFPSEGVDFEDKTWHPLDVPTDGFDSLTQDYLNDTYDYGVIGGPAEAFGDRAFTADRSAPLGLMINVYVHSPRFRFIYEGPTTVVRQWPRSPDGRGLSAGTRIFPAPKSGRVFGGEQ